MSNTWLVSFLGVWALTFWCFWLRNPEEAQGHRTGGLGVKPPSKELPCPTGQWQFKTTASVTSGTAKEGARDPELRDSDGIQWACELDMQSSPSRVKQAGPFSHSSSSTRRLIYLKAGLDGDGSLLSETTYSVTSYHLGILIWFC